MNNTVKQCGAQLVEQPSGCWQVQGDLNFNSVIGLRETGYRLIRQARGRCQFDFGAVGAVDSTALSLILCWLRVARQAGVDVRLTHLPAELIAIARLSDLDDLIVETV